MSAIVFSLYVLYIHTSKNVTKFTKVRHCNSYGRINARFFSVTFSCEHEDIHVLCYMYY